MIDFSKGQFACPVCGYQAEVSNTDAARSWAEIKCENCATYALTNNALEDVPHSDLYLLSGYYRHAVHEPMQMQCDSQETVKEHIEQVRGNITHDHQLKALLQYYYWKMSRFGDKIQFQPFPAIAYARDKSDLMDIVTEAVKRGYVEYDGNFITVTQQGKEWMDTVKPVEPRIRNEIFISHRLTDAHVSDLIKNFLVMTGFPNNKVFCSSLRGNGVAEKIGKEVKEHLQKAAIIILLLSRDYYESAYCLNEAGVAWYLDGVRVIPFGFPEVTHENMRGFVNAEFKLRRLDDDGDIAYLYDEANRLYKMEKVSKETFIQEVQKLKNQYQQHIKERKVATEESIEDLHAVIEELKARLEEYEEDDVSPIDYDDEIWNDGYHEVKNGDGKVLKKGTFEKGHLIDGVEYSVVLKIAKGPAKDDFEEDENEEPVSLKELGKVKFHYEDYGQYDGVFSMMIGKRNIVERGLEFFYVADKYVKFDGKEIIPTFKNFRTLESMLAKFEPDELEEIKTGVHKYNEARTAFFDVED